MHLLVRSIAALVLLVSLLAVSPRARADAIVVTKAMTASTIGEITIQPVDGVWKVTGLDVLQEERL